MVAGVQSEVKAALANGRAVELFDALGWETADIPICGNAWRAWGWSGPSVEGRMVARAPGCRVVVVREPMQRELVLTVHRHAPLETVLWAFFADEALTIAFAKNGRLRTMTVDVCHPDPTGLDRLLQLVPEALTHPAMADPAAAAAAQLSEILDQEELTRAFFAGFAAALGRLQAATIDGPDAPEARWQASLIVLLRLIFVYFLQREGLLDGDRRYLVRRLRADPEAFFDSVLRPLFFGVLNTPPGDRDLCARALGDVPFLNGGLFEPTATEREHPGMRWPADVLTQVIEELFERYHFTAVEPNGDDEARVVDPQMLGKVFEGLMYGDRRRVAGAFYTPRDVVRRMVDEGLDRYLEERRAQGCTAADALETVRILDPAVGTGAFLLEAFASIKARRRALGLAVDYPAMREVVHRHLFGVDRDPTAVRLCELRLWLALLATVRETGGAIGPLPNLGHRVVAGDSLLDGADLTRLRAGGLAPAWVREVARIEARLEVAQHAYLTAHGADKIEHRRRMQEQERELERTLLTARRDALVARLAPLRALAASTDLFGEPMATTSQRDGIALLEEELALVESHLTAVQRGEAVAPPFGYETRFGVAAREGFDLVVTNPPWVRAQRVERSRRKLLAQRYQTASGGLWAGAEALGIRAPYGPQADLAALFVERSLELLRPGGHLAALVPAKLFRGLHGAPLRELLSRQRVESVEDLSDARAQMFDATVYPAIVHVQKAAPLAKTIDIRLWRRDRCDRLVRSPAQLTWSGRPGEPWCLVPDAVDAILRRVRAHSALLGEYGQWTPRRGVFTGANEVFLRPRGGFETELGPEVRPFVRPAVSGSGLGATPAQEILWCYAPEGPLPRLPSTLQDYFERRATQLTARADHDPHGALWQLFRVRADVDAAKVAWRDMSVFLEPVEMGPGPVALNTVYYVPFDDTAEAAGFARWMGSSVVRAAAYALAERARGGWRRHFAWVIQLLPVPNPHERWRDFDPGAFGLRDDEEETLRAWLEDDLAQEAA